MKKLQEIFEVYGEMVENDNIDYIGMVSSCVKTTEPKQFEKVFRKWVLDSVANVFELEKNTNTTCLVLCGEQGTCKTSFLASLFPPYEYSFIGHVDLKHKDSRLMLADTFLIVLDGFLGGLKEREWTVLKANFHLPKVKERWHYAKTVEQRPRVANFCAASNFPSAAFSEQSALVAFDLDGAIDMDGFDTFTLRDMWGQAYLEYKELNREKGLKQ